MTNELSKEEIVYTIKAEFDGNYETNRMDKIEDQQCELCLDWIIHNWYIVKSFVGSEKTGRAICLDCGDSHSQTLKSLLDALDKRIEEKKKLIEHHKEAILHIQDENSITTSLSINDNDESINVQRNLITQLTNEIQELQAIRGYVKDE